MPSIPSSYRLEENVAPIRALAAQSNDYRALVCVFMLGGSDSHNLVVPRSGNNRAVYDAVRGIHGVTLGSELPLTADWGLHPNMTEIKARFDAGQAAVVMNVGFMKLPTDRNSFLNKSVRLPEQLFSHNSQTLLWQALPGLTELTLLSGWMGRASELAGDLYNPSSLNDIGAAFSIAGRALQVAGYETNASVMQSTGATAFGAGENRTVASGTFAAALAAARVRSEWGNVIQGAMATRVQRAIANQEALAANLASLPTAADNRYSALGSNSLAQQLKCVARIIHSRSSYGHRRDVFFVALGGFDTHDNLGGRYPGLIDSVDKAMGAFYLSMQDLGLGEHVTAFTASEFGRTLIVNATLGSDHGWGGHHLVVGGAVNAGVYGTVDLTTNGPMDAGQGRLIPTMSVEQYISPMLRWWGIPEAQVPLVLQNRSSFPATEPNLLREPVSSLPTPTMEVNFMDGFQNGGQFSHPLMTFSRSGPRARFDERGVLKMPRQNLIANSHDFSGVALGIIGSGGVLPNRWSVSAVTGVTIEVVGRGDLEDGSPYIDVRFFGETATAQFPRLWVASADAGSRFPVRAGARIFASMMAHVVAGDPSSLTALHARGNNLLGGTTVSDWSLSGLTTTDYVISSTSGRRFVPVNIPSSGVDNCRYGVFLTTQANVPFDVTVRIAKPMAGYCVHHGAIGTYRGPAEVDYVPTYGTLVDNPIFDYDPVTLRPLGALLAPLARNSVLNSVGAGAAIGTPGTLPTGWAVDYSSAVTGITTSVVDVGSERGMPYVDIRVAGTPSATAEMNLRWAAPSASEITVGANAAWTSSAYLALKAGALPTAGGAPRVRSVARNGTTVVNESSNTTGVFSDLADKPITHQRFQTAMTTGAGSNNLLSGVVFFLTAGQYVDFTLRIAAPQAENLSGASPWIPTFGTSVQTAAEDFSVTGAALTSIYNAAASTLAGRFCHDIPVDLAVNAFPQFMAVSDGTSNNRLAGFFSSSTQRAAHSSWSGGSSNGDITPVRNVARRAPFSMAFAAAANNSNACTMGVLGAPDATVTMPTGVNLMRLGNANSPGSHSIWAQRFSYFNSRLTDAELVTLTSQ
jgi:uncharacterized protein (DUF1501 family)